MEFCVKLLSLPLWERGLKCNQRAKEIRKKSSLPLWERGLKSDRDPGTGEQEGSLPLWERGLKSLVSQVLGHFRRRRSPCGSVD